MKDNYTCLGRFAVFIIVLITCNRACIPTDIGIAFEMVKYTVSESTGKVEVTVSTNLVLNFAPVTVQVSSENGSARGIITYYNHIPFTTKAVHV